MKVLGRISEAQDAVSKEYVDGLLGSGGSGTVDSEMSDTSENAVQNKVVKAYVDEHEKVASHALNHLDKRVKTLEGLKGVTGEELEEAVSALEDKLTQEALDNEMVTAGALAELNERTASIEETIQNDLVSDELLKEAAEEINEEVLDNEEAVAAALSDLNKRIVSLLADLVGQYAKKLDTDRADESTRTEMLSNEEVTAYGFAVIYRELEDIKRRIYLLETR